MPKKPPQTDPEDRYRYLDTQLRYLRKTVANHEREMDEILRALPADRRAALLAERYEQEPPRRGAKPEASDEDVVNAVVAAGGNLAEAARSLGLGADAIRMRLKRRADLRVAADEAMRGQKKST